VTYSKRVEKKLTKKEKRYETDQLMKEKRSEDMQVWEEVFDRTTLMIIYGFMNNGIINEIHGVVRSGKEARVYWAKDKKGNELAIKIYLTVSSEFRKGMVKYIEGDPRFRDHKHDTRSLIYAWTQKEFKNLQLAASAGVKVPRPIAVKDNVLVMEFIGENGDVAPTLKEKSPEDPEIIYDEVLVYLRKLYKKARLVHGDLSEYNIMMYKERPVIFDMSQAVLNVHPNAELLLRRDITNLNNFFRRLNVEVLTEDEAYQKVTGSGPS
jgi:RIO kinase 1